MYYRRFKTYHLTYFFTINLADRKSSLLVDEINTVKKAIKFVKLKHPFKINGIVIMPEHFHMIITLPENDPNYSDRIGLIKAHFSRAIKSKEYISNSRILKRERGIWQRRFWEHAIRNETDYEQHLNYIHYNPVKHGYVKNPTEWQYTSLHHYIRLGMLPKNWTFEEILLQSVFGEG